MNKPNESKTPETDAFAECLEVYDKNGQPYTMIESVPSEVARRLEAERDQARTELASEKQYAADMKRLNGLEREEKARHKAANDQLRAEVERLREALAADDIVPKSVGDRLIDLRAQLAQRDEALKVAREALLKTLYEIGVKTDGVCGDTVISTHSIVNPMRFAQDCLTALRRIEELTKGEKP